MSDPRIFAALLAGALTMVPALGLAQSGGTPSPGTNPNAPGTAPSPSPDAASVEVEAKLKAEAEDQAKANAKARLDAILERGAKEPVKARTDAEAKIQKHIQAVDDGAVKEGDAKLAERLGAEFGMGAEAVLTEKQNLGASWGELMLAHLLQAHSNSTLTVEQIHQAKKDGSGWGQIAAGMGFKLGDVVSAARAEARVANGLAKADGKVHPIGVSTGGKAAARSAKPETDAPRKK